MEQYMGLWFATCSGLAWAFVVAGAWLFRNRFYAAFAGVVLGIHTLVSVALAPMLAWAWPLYAALQVTVYVHFIGLMGARMSPRCCRWLISVPASFFVAATFLALPWAVLHAFALQPIWPWLPYAV